ncbi:MAG TPA: DUF1670 domain-containing protein [Capsulimonadaceae bacterium]|jgi:hypothetical protein
MIAPSASVKQYSSARKRLLKEQIGHFFEQNFPRLFGPDIRDRIAQQLLGLVETQMPAYANLKPGQCLWNAVAIDTRADSKKMTLVPVILTLVDEEDIKQLAAGISPPRVAQDSVARLMEEAYQQGALLSVRDIGLLTWRAPRNVTGYRQAWEARNGRLLPHPGTLQDMGSCVTHKKQIVVKAVYQHIPTSQVAQQTRHTQRAVDRYLTDFYRVRTSYRHCKEIDFICQVTGMSKFLVKQYIEIIREYESEALTSKAA